MSDPFQRATQHPSHSYPATQLPFNQDNDYQSLVDPVQRAIFGNPGPHVLYDPIESFGDQPTLTTTPNQINQYLSQSYPTNEYNITQYNNFQYPYHPNQTPIFENPGPHVLHNSIQSFNQPPTFTTKPPQAPQPFLPPTTLGPQSGTSTASNSKGAPKRKRYHCLDCNYTSDRRQNVKAHGVCHVSKAQLEIDGKLLLCNLQGCTNQKGFKRISDLRRHARRCALQNTQQAPSVPKIVEGPSSIPPPHQQSYPPLELTMDQGDFTSSQSSSQLPILFPFQNLGNLALDFASPSQSTNQPTCQFPFQDLIFPPDM